MTKGKWDVRKLVAAGVLLVVGLVSFFWLVLLWCLILLTTLQFSALDRRTFWLMLPYLAWVAFAGYLNLGIFWLNR